MKYRIIFFSVLAITLLSSSITRADPLDNWHWINPYPTGKDLYAAAYGNGMYLAVGQDGAVISSKDAINWESAASDITLSLSQIVYGNETFVAGGNYSGAIYSTKDGTHWTKTDNYIFDGHLAFGNGVFVSILSNPECMFATCPSPQPNIVFTSHDGVNWTEKNLGTVYNIDRLIFGNGIFAAVIGNSMLTSPDGKDWTFSTLPQDITPVAFANGVFISISPIGEISTSQDLVHWKKLSVVNNLSSTSYSRLSFGNGVFVIWSWDYIHHNYIAMTSPDLLQWTSLDISGFSSINELTFAGDFFMLVGPYGLIAVSPDCSQWSVKSSRIDGSFTDGAYGNGSYVVVGYSRDNASLEYHGKILSSADGRRWLETESGITSQFNAVAFGNGKFVSVGNKGAILTSSDGFSWTARNSGTAADFIDIIFAKDMFVAVGDSIATSPDGENWTQRRTVTETLTGVAYGNNVFIAVGPSGVFYYSPDAIIWKSVYLDFNYGFTTIAFGNGRFVAAANGATAISTNARAWSFYGQVNYDYSASAITFSKDLFVVAGKNGIQTSSTGEAWSKRDSPVDLVGIFFGVNSFIAMGSGTIVQSDPVINKCAASVSSDLDTLHIPVVKFDGVYFWADMVNEPAGDGTLVYRVTDYGESDPYLYSDCLTSTLTSDFRRLHMPSAVYNDNLLWADMESIPSTDGEMRFRATRYGALGKTLCSATASEDLATLYIPILNHAGEYFWADLEKTGTLDGNFTYKVMRYGKADPNNYAECQVSSLTDDFTHLTVPEIFRGGTTIWAELEVIPSNAEEINFRITASGEY